MKPSEYKSYQEDTYYSAHLENVLQFFDSLFDEYTYDELFNIFEVFRRKDQDKPTYLSYQMKVKKDIYIALKGTNLIEGIKRSNIDEITNLIFDNYIKNLQQLPIYLVLMKNKSNMGNLIEYKNLDILENLSKQGKGGVIVSHHWGSFRYTIMGLISKDIPITIIIADYLVDFFKEILTKGEYSNIKVLPIYTGINNESDDLLITLLECVRELRKGGFVLMFSDKSVYPSKQNEETKSVEFLGNKIRAPYGHIKLAQHAGCPLVHVHSKFLKNNKIEITFSKLIELEEINQNLHKVVESSMRHMEDILMKEPELWTYFTDYHKMKIY